MKVFLAGPGDRAAFAAAARQLAAAGYVPVNPAKRYGRLTATRTAVLRRALVLMMTADALALLSGWHTDPACLLAVEVATMLGMPHAPLGDWVDSDSRSLLFLPEP